MTTLTGNARPPLAASSPARVPSTPRRLRPCERRLAMPVTLDEVIVDVWEGLTASRSVACPVCGGEMRPSPAALQPSGGCTDCGARLS